jgi:hypothetical protein
MHDPGWRALPQVVFVTIFANRSSMLFPIKS